MEMSNSGDLLNFHPILSTMFIYTWVYIMEESMYNKF